MYLWNFVIRSNFYVTDKHVLYNSDCALRFTMKVGEFHAICFSKAINRILGVLLWWSPFSMQIIGCTFKIIIFHFKSKGNISFRKTIEITIMNPTLLRCGYWIEAPKSTSKFSQNCRRPGFKDDYLEDRRESILRSFLTLLR